MSYWKQVFSRAFKETCAFWNLHQVWKYVASTVSAVILRLLVKRLAPIMGWQGFLKELFGFGIFGLFVSWVGTFLINLIRVSGLLHVEQQQVISKLETETQLLKSAQDERAKMNFDFRLHVEPKSSAHVDVKITPIQRASVSMDGLCLRVRNLGPNHFEISNYKLSTSTSSAPRTITTDVHVQPGAEESLDISEEMAPLLFVQKDWQGFPDKHEVEIEIECKDAFDQRSVKWKRYRLDVKKTGGFSVAFTVSPLGQTNFTLG